MPKEGHYVNRTGWLRASVLGANDGIVSTASLLVGVIAAGMDHANVVLTGLAGLTAGAFSMAAGEYVSVSAQSDTEAADLERERRALREDPDYELDELTAHFADNGVQDNLARQVAEQMTEHDALAAHARSELGLWEDGAANPLQAAWTSAVSFAVGAGLPLLGVLVMPGASVAMSLAVVATVTLMALMALGAVGAHMGGAPIGPGVLRVLFWGSVAMAVTAAVGRLFGVTMA
ncbi:VIT family protein [Sediminimonas sp.]|uniref:VIT1/CCC1 transporter family protein n=1 Tax=Sediminimonas sp. TaxID=2823379 RepID=UPI0025F40396|nr:VIT family protein [Sediminimonas sp.]